jgi:hypothetical protein
MKIIFLDIDGDDVDLEQMEGLEEHFFQTEFEEGLTREQSLKIINHLNSN